MVYFMDLDIKHFIIALKNWYEKDWSDEDITKLFQYLDSVKKN